MSTKVRVTATIDEDLLEQAHQLQPTRPVSHILQESLAAWVRAEIDRRLVVGYLNDVSHDEMSLWSHPAEPNSLLHDSTDWESIYADVLA